MVIKNDALAKLHNLKEQFKNTALDDCSVLVTIWVRNLLNRWLKVVLRIK